MQLTRSSQEAQREMIRLGPGANQSEFVAALLDPGRSIPAGLIGPDGEPSARRFAVYRNNVVVGLGETLKASFPVVCRIVGDEFFMAMARVYVAQEPPVSPVMLEYGKGFPDFIGAFEPAAGLPYLRDVALLERAWLDAYYAPDADALQPDAFAAVMQDQVASLRLSLHPSVRVVRSSFPVLSIWQTHTEGAAPGPIDLAGGGEDVLVCRPHSDVEVRRLGPGSAVFLLELASGLSIIDATRKALAWNARFDLSGNLADLIGAGTVVSFSFKPQSSFGPT